MAGIWNVLAAISRFKIAPRILAREKTIPEDYKSLSGYIVIEVINLLFGGVLGIVLIGFDLYVRDQILTHIGSTPLDLIDYTQKQGILVEAYSPVAHGKIFGSESLAAMAATYKVKIVQICIRYCLQLGLLPLPKTVTPAYMDNNAAVDFEISAADMEALKHISAFNDYGEASRFAVFGPNKQTKNR